MQPKLSPTRIQTFQRCKQRYHWTYDAGERQVAGDVEALVRGAVYHEGMAAYFRGGAWDQIASAMWMEMSGGNALLSEEQLEEFFLACQVLRAYIAQDRDHWIAEEAEQWKEGEWETEEGRVVRLIGKWDLVVLSRGKRWIVDHKFSKNTSNGKVYEYSLQAGMYLLQAKLLEEDIAGVIFNLVNYKTGKIQKKVEVRTDAFLENLRKELENIAEEIENYKPTRTLTSSCPWDCPFAVKCLEGMEKHE